MQILKSLLLLLSTCIALSASSQETLNLSFEHEGLSRSYILYVPQSYEAGNPMVLNFHGYTSNALDQYLYSDFTGLADEHGFLVAHPQGTPDGFGNNHWNVGWGFSTVDDVSFTAALIDTIAENYNINQERVYSTGMSNGGFFSYRLACELSDRIAAIASVTGTMTTGLSNTCSAEHPMPVMQIHGTDDPTVAYNGATGFDPIEDVVAYWVEQTNANASPLFETLPDIDPNDDSTAEHEVYESGDAGATVEFYRVINGGHTWPGASVTIGVTCQDFDASAEIWRFFSQFDINGLLTPNTVEEYEDYSLLSVSPNPSAGQVQISWKGELSPYQVLDMSGKVLLEGVLNPTSNLVDLSQLKPGAYILFSAGISHRLFITN